MYRVAGERSLLQASTRRDWNRSDRVDRGCGLQVRRRTGSEAGRALLPVARVVVELLGYIGVAVRRGSAHWHLAEPRVSPPQDPSAEDLAKIALNDRLKSGWVARPNPRDEVWILGGRSCHAWAPTHGSSFPVQHEM